jgi:hypothetical protein
MSTTLAVQANPLGFSLGFAFSFIYLDGRNLAITLGLSFFTFRFSIGT